MIKLLFEKAKLLTRRIGVKIGSEAPGLVMDDTKLVDEEEVYRFFGGCLPVVLANRKYYFKTLRQLNAQRVGHASNKSITFK